MLGSRVCSPDCYQESNCRALNLASVDMEGFTNGSCDDGTGKPSTRVTVSRTIPCHKPPAAHASTG